MTSKEPGLAALETISEKLKPTYDNDEDAEWSGHSLQWIRTKPSARIGKIGRLFVKAICENSGLQAKTKGYSLVVADKRPLVVAGKEIQVRFSTGWSGGGFKFEQLRYESYLAVFCLGITPKRAYGWVIPKNIIFDTKGVLLKKPALTTQHKGKGGSDTAWINVDVQSIPPWMEDHGGSLADATDHLKSLLI
jgi:hypothetical protein